MIIRRRRVRVEIEHRSQRVELFAKPGEPTPIYPAADAPTPAALEFPISDSSHPATCPPHQKEEL